MPGDMFEFNIKGLQETTDGIKKTINPEKIRHALILGGLAIEAEAKRTAQVDTGRLRASYSTNWDGSGMQTTPVIAPAKAGDGVSQPSKGFGDIAVVRVGSNVSYGIFIEYGTRNMQPYMTVHNAAQNLMSQVEQLLRDAVNK